MCVHGLQPVTVSFECNLCYSMLVCISIQYYFRTNIEKVTIISPIIFLIGRKPQFCIQRSYAEFRKKSKVPPAVTSLRTNFRVSQHRYEVPNVALNFPCKIASLARIRIFLELDFL